MNTVNAGGNSIVSEAISYEIFYQIYKAKLLRTEMEIRYILDCKKIDYSMKINDTRYGVSVTRVFRSDKEKMTKDEIRTLISKKINGLVVSNRYTYDKWDIGILHMFVRKGSNKYKLFSLLKNIKIPQNIILYVSIINNSGDFILANTIDIFY